MQSTWLEDDPGGKQWDAEQVNKTFLNLFLRFNFLNKINFGGALFRRQPTFAGKCVKENGYRNYQAKQVWIT